MSDDLERMFRQLVKAIQQRYPDYMTRPFEVGELYQNVLPYRLYRRELGLDTNQDYEATLSELLTGARGYLVVEDRMADALRRELQSPNPEPGAFRQFATSQVSLSPEAVARLAEEPGAGPVVHLPEPPRAAADATATRPRMSSQTEPRGPVTSGGAMSAVPAPQRPTTPAGGGRSPLVANPGDTCRFCGGALPAGRPITFCPHCGQDQTVLHCEACGTELEVGWKFCTTCGRGVGQS